MSTTDSHEESAAMGPLNDAVAALDWLANHVSFHDDEVSEAWLKSKCAVITMRDHLADPALGEAIAYVDDLLRNRGGVCGNDYVNTRVQFLVDTLTVLRPKPSPNELLGNEKLVVPTPTSTGTGEQDQLADTNASSVVKSFPHNELQGSTSGMPEWIHRFIEDARSYMNANGLKHTPSDAVVWLADRNANLERAVRYERDVALQALDRIELLTAKVEEEREACVRIAEDERDIESDHENHSGGVGSAACQRIAQRIRSRPSPSRPAGGAE